MTATVLTVAFVVFSCKQKLSEADKLDITSTPLQSVDNFYMLQTENGRVQLRVEAPLLERYDSDTISYELFPKGLNVYAYKEDGILESTIQSDKARHEKNKNTDDEIWMAFGNVIVKNIVNQQIMETDTLYWDRKNHEIYTDCYIKMFSPDGFMQGYGMRSDERASNSIILKPFNSYGVVVQDSTEVRTDTVNFIGPRIKK
jgi:hypothetical protein